MIRSRPAGLIVLGVAALLLSVSCGRKAPTIAPHPSADPGVVPEPEPARQSPFDLEPFARSPLEVGDVSQVLQTVYFDFDRSELRDDAKAALRSNASALQAQPALAVVIEGHCDERGTIEYNLALGQRRAAAVRDYLAALGVKASRMSTVSYGEEMPADAGHSEAAWAKNRRANFSPE